MVFNATFNNISVISWWSVSLVEETGVPKENHRQTLSHNVVSSTPRLSEIQTHNVSGDGLWLQRSCKSNYHTITTTTTPDFKNDRQYNGQGKKRTKETNNGRQNTTQKSKYWIGPYKPR